MSERNMEQPVNEPDDEEPSGGAPDRGTSKEVGIVTRALAVVVVLALGIGGFMGLSMLKKPPAEAKTTERVLSASATVVQLEDAPVTMTGLGEVRALNVVPVSPEISGKVVEIHPRLEMGETIAEGELLLRIDPRDYTSAQTQAEAQVDQMNQRIERLQRQYDIDKARLKTLERNEALMQRDFERTRDLFENDDVGTRSAVDHVEMQLNQAADARDQLAQALALYPVQIQEARSALEGAVAQLEISQVNLGRTEIRAPFDARIKAVNVEQGQYVTPAAPVVTLADDQVLEISVSLDSRDAKDWLQFDPTAPSSAGWFGELKPVTCEVAWTEDAERHRWEGKVHRIETFDQQNRTISVAVRVSADAARSSSDGLPLVEGMFCKVSIPGKPMEQVFRLPRWAVTYEGNAYVVRDGRLAIQAVDVVRSEGQETFVRGGLSPGDKVITTRLTNPLPNTLVRLEDETESAS